MASSNTTPNDSPSIDGAHAMVAPRRCCAFSISDTCPSHWTRGILRAFERGGLLAHARDPQVGVAVQIGERVEQHGQALARFVAADEEDRGRVARTRFRVAVERHVDAVEQDLAVNAEGGFDITARLLRHRGTHRQAVDHLLQRAPQHDVPLVVTGLVRRVERADGREIRTNERGVRRAGSERLVQVHDVGREAPQRFECARAATRWFDVIGAIEPLLGKRRDGPTVVIPGSGGGPSHGAITRVSTPARRRARASPSTWPWTPPNTDNE